MQKLEQWQTSGCERKEVVACGSVMSRPIADCPSLCLSGKEEEPLVCLGNLIYFRSSLLQYRELSEH